MAARCTTTGGNSMKKRTWAIAIAGAALAIVASAPMIAQASTGGKVTAGSGIGRQISTVSAKEVSTSAPTRLAAGLGNSFWEAVWGGSYGPASQICVNGSTAGVYNWSSTCANNEDQVQNATGYYARVHYGYNGYGAYACMNPHSYWLYLSTTSYDFSY